MKKLIVAWIIVVSSLGVWINSLFFRPVTPEDSMTETEFKKEVKADPTQPDSLSAGLAKVMVSQQYMLTQPPLKDTQPKPKEISRAPASTDALEAIFGVRPFARELITLIQNPKRLTPEEVDRFLADNPVESFETISNALNKMGSSNGDLSREFLLKLSFHIPGKKDEKIELWQKELTQSDNTVGEKLFAYDLILKSASTFEDALSQTKKAMQATTNPEIQKGMIHSLISAHPENEEQIRHSFDLSKD